MIGVWRQLMKSGPFVVRRFLPRRNSWTANQPGQLLDIYALGLLLYQAASGGQLLFERQITFAEFGSAVVAFRALVRASVIRFAGSLARICETASSPSPAGRYRDVAAMCAAIDTLELPAARQARRRLLLMWVASLCAAVVLGMALGPSPWRGGTAPGETVMAEALIAEDYGRSIDRRTHVILSMLRQQILSKMIRTWLRSAAAARRRRCPKPLVTTNPTSPLPA